MQFFLSDTELEKHQEIPPVQDTTPQISWDHTRRCPPYSLQALQNKSIANPATSSPFLP